MRTMDTALTNVQLEFFDDQANKTVILSGDISFGEIISENTSSRNASVQAPRDGSDAQYDQHGAMLYVVIVIIVYSLSMSFLVMTLARKRSRKRVQDREVTKYLRGIEGARQQAKEENVKRMRLKWPGNFIGPRFNSRRAVSSISAFDIENLPEWPCMMETMSEFSYTESSTSSDSYIEVPSVTVLRTGDRVSEMNPPPESCPTLGVKYPEGYRPRTRTNELARIKHHKHQRSTDSGETVIPHHIPGVHQSALSRHGSSKHGSCHVTWDDDAGGSDVLTDDSAVWVKHKKTASRDSLSAILDAAEMNQKIHARI